MYEITVYCKDNKAIKVFLGKKDIFSGKEEEIKKEGIVRCENLEKLLENSVTGKNVDFSKYINFDILEITNFEKKVYIETMNIPKGQVKTYKEIGESIGSNGYRSIGNALNKNPIPILIPCHRVVGSNMTLTGFRGGLNMKKEILINEGLKVKKEKIINN